MTIRDRVGNTPDNLGFKAPCRVATTANIVLSGLQTIDGIALVGNDRVLVWKQTDHTQNGIYQASSGNWTRPHDADNNEAFIQGTQVYVTSGTANGNLDYALLCDDDPVIIGTSLITWFVPASPTGVPSSRQINTTAPLAGGGNLANDRTLTLGYTAAFTLSGSSLDLATNGITYAKLQQVAGSRLLGNPTGSAANTSEISLGATLAFSGTALQTAALTGDVTAAANSFVTAIATNAVTNAKIRQSAALSVVGNAGSTTANVDDIAGTANQALRVNSAGTALAFGAINLAAAAAVTGTLAVANGGTGATTLTNHGILLGQGTSAIAATAVMTDGQLLVGQSAADPLPKTVSGDATLAASGALTIANAAVTYAKIQNISTTQRVLGRNSAGAGVTEEVSAPGVLDWISSTRGALLRRGATGWEPINPGTAGTVLTSNGTGADPTYQAVSGTGTVTNIAVDGSLYGGPITTSGTLGVAVPCNPGGRLTISTGVPVMTTTVSAATTIYYTPYIHRFVPIYDGTRFVQTDIGAELSQATTDSTKSPAAVAASKNYDMFVWSDSGTIRCTRGPDWTAGAVAGSDTGRGTGAGSTELQRLNGVWTNKNAITNGPGANKGTYVGTVRSNGLSQIDWIIGASGNAPTAAALLVWNMYNRVTAANVFGDTVATWTYATATWREANGRTTMQAAYVVGFAEDAIEAIYYAVYNAGAGTAVVGVGVDSTSAPSGLTGSSSSPGGGASGNISSPAVYKGVPGLGYHYVAALEDAVSATTITGIGSTSQITTGLSYTLRM